MFDPLKCDKNTYNDARKTLKQAYIMPRLCITYMFFSNTNILAITVFSCCAMFIKYYHFLYLLKKEKVLNKNTGKH